MSNTNGYEVLVDELTVHKAVRQLAHPITGEPMGWQQGNGETWFLGEVIPAEAINPEWVEALESGEGEMYEALKDKLAPSSDEPAVSDAVRMGMPFEGYADMDEEDILAAMAVLPSATVTRIKEWESQRGEGRENIVNFNIGYGVDPNAYQEGRVPGGGEQVEGDESKPVRAMRTRQVAEEDGPTIAGEGITGTGDPQVAPGTAAAEEADDDNGGAKRATKRRAGRRPRPVPAKTPPKSDGDDNS